MGYEVDILASKVGAKDGSIKVSTSFLEEYFDISREALRKWENKGCPKLGRGSWDLIEVLKWRGGLAATGEGEPESDKDVYLRKTRADAFLKEQQGSIAEIELLKLRGKVVEIDEVERVIGGIIMNTKGLLQALPTKAAPRLLGVSALSELIAAFQEREKALALAKKPKEIRQIIGEVIEDFQEAKSLAEIGEVLNLMIHEALVELSDMSIALFEEDEHEGEHQEDS